MPGPHHPLHTLRLVAVIGGVLTGTMVDARGEPATDSAEDRTALAAFEDAIAPLVTRRCLGCHSGEDPAGSLDLTTREALLAGGDSGPAAVVGAAGESLIVERVREGSMPPQGRGQRLSNDEVQALAAWIDAGLHWPPARRLNPRQFTTEARAGLDWWSLQPVARPVPPAVEGAAWVRNPIDAFVLRGLEEQGLAPSPEADRGTLLRRAKFDLLGLPPTPEELDEFESDTAGDAYQRLVERLLASPHYGERWGRHWLDVVRFGETDGYETNKPRPNAWPYRDYVIRALNEDRSYQRFILEQLAGDQVGEDAATGFLVGGTHDVVGIANIEGQLQQRANDLDDILSTTATAFLGLSAGCARCHDHKFDPIAQRDYYAIQAVFAGVRHGERELKPADYEERIRTEPDVRRQLAAVERQLAEFEPVATVGAGERGPPARPAVHALGNIDRFAPAPARFVRFTVLATNQAEPCLDELEVFSADAEPRNVALASAGAKATASGVFADGTSPLHKLAHVNDGQYGNSHSWISSTAGAGWVAIELPQVATIDRVAWARDREGKFSDRLPVGYRIEIALDPGDWRLVAGSDDRRAYEPGAKRALVTPDSVPPDRADELRQVLARREALLARLPGAGMQKIYAGQFEKPPTTHRLHRGDPMQPREAIAPAGLTAVAPRLELPADAPEHERRQALAAWIGDPANPLTARVIVNRLWHYHFGQGLVATPSNLGFHGGRPSHPELLDWLAAELLARGWSLKTMHRLIMLSATYRQGSRPDPQSAAVDAGNRLLWRFAPRRLEAEPIRDAILAASRRLDLRLGGPGYDPFEPNDSYVHVYQPRQSFGPAEWRRMVYQLKPRVLQDATFGAFDCPDASQVAPRRNVSTTAIQALNLLNSPFVVQQADEFARQLRGQAGDDPRAQARAAFRIALGRAPDDDEARRACELIARHGLPALCRAIYNANEFVYVD